MIHHDNSRSYEVAVSDAAKHFQTKLEQQIHGSVERVTRVIEQVQNDVPQDAIVLGRTLKFNPKWEPQERGVFLQAPEGQALKIHDHALAQIGERAKIRNLNTVVREMRDRGEWGAQLVAHMFTEIYSHLNGDRFLLRQVRGELRGFLSDSFRRLDSRPVMEAFIRGIQKYGARPVDGFALQTKVKVRAVLPYVFEPFPGEIMSFGAELSDSDYGDGALGVRGFVTRMWCTNLATTEEVLNQVHLGKRLPDNMKFSEQTYLLDTEAMSSAVHDVTGNVLSADAVNRYLDMVRTANEEKIETHAITAWVKKNLNKEESEKAVNKFTSPEMELLPAGQTTWRWSNALSWLANETTDERRKLELQDLAGGFIQKKKA
jgi:hypothetical protein